MNDSQQRSILIGFQDIHRQLAEFESILAQRLISSPFSQYVDDLSPTEDKVIQDYFARLRAIMLTCLGDADIPLELRKTSTRWALQCGMTFLHIAVSELGPERLRGYGELDAQGRAHSLKIEQELTRLIDRVATYLRQGLGHDFTQRLARLEATTLSVETLQLLDRIITRWGLVEFRSQLDLIVRRLEAPQFEIAVFGRVGSGKSSLLNHIVGQDVLPVGVTPVTAVPTRLVKGDPPAAMIAFAEVPPQTVSIAELHEYASEEGNPGNHKHVINILVQFPAPRLRDGVILVDTPGIGSLARAGGAETFAYLPRCDLGVVLIDAASTLTPDDLDLLRLLYEAGIPAQVVLSKADLLSAADRQRTVQYVGNQIRRELGLDLLVHPISTVGTDEALLMQWFDQEIEPLFSRHRALTDLSLRRKLGHLRESVLAVLQTLATHGAGGARDGPIQVAAETARKQLDQADKAIRNAQRRCRDWRDDEAALLEIVVRDAAATVIATADSNGASVPPVLDVLQRVLAERDQMAQELAKKLQRDLANVLEDLRKSAPGVDVDSGPIRDLALRGLPAPEYSAWGNRLRCRRPWWAAALRPLALWSTRQAIAQRLGATLREQIDNHDRQLLAWLKAYVGKLTEVYEAQAEVFREQIRRVSGATDDGGAIADVGEIRSDIEQLRRAGESAPAHEGRDNNMRKEIAS